MFHSAALSGKTNRRGRGGCDDSKIDVLVSSETKIDSSVNDNEICLPGFEVVRKDRSVNGRSGGGLCIYLRRQTINYQIRDDLCDDHLESVLSSKLMYK